MNQAMVAPLFLHFHHYAALPGAKALPRLARCSRHAARFVVAGNGSNGPANQYLEYFPFIDKAICGEGFHFNLMSPDFWLVEASGIPYGIMNDIFFQDAVNNRRGMVFGMAVRVGQAWPMWKLWDEFGIADSRLLGYWEQNPAVTTDHTNIVATTYAREGRALIAIGSWLHEPANVRLNIDWKRLGLTPSGLRIRAPGIAGYQTERLFQPGELVPIPILGDCLIILSNDSRGVGHMKEDGGGLPVSPESRPGR